MDKKQTKEIIEKTLLPIGVNANFFSELFKNELEKNGIKFDDYNNYLDPIIAVVEKLNKENRDCIDTLKQLITNLVGYVSCSNCNTVKEMLFKSIDEEKGE